jgi:hypothetical protein
MGLMDRGATALVSRMKSSAGRTVTYTRKSDAATLDLTAWVGNSHFDRDQADPGAARDMGERDYLFAVADLVISGTAFTPAKGDTITETINGTATRFAVAPNAGEPAWRYSEQTRLTIRVHTKRT